MSLNPRASAAACASRVCGSATGLVGLTSSATNSALGNSSRTSCSLFCANTVLTIHRDGSTRPVETGYKAESDWIGPGNEDDGDRRCCGLGSKYRWWSERADHRYLALDEIGRHRWQWTITIRYPAVFDPHVLTLDIAHFGKTTPECGIEMHGVGLRQAAEISNHRHCRLLRSRRERPRGRAAEQCYELAALHSITSSARASSVGGISRPSSLAV